MVPAVETRVYRYLPYLLECLSATIGRYNYTFFPTAASFNSDNVVAMGQADGSSVVGTTGLDEGQRLRIMPDM